MTENKTNRDNIHIGYAFCTGRMYFQHRVQSWQKQNPLPGVVSKAYPADSYLLLKSGETFLWF